MALAHLSFGVVALFIALAVFLVMMLFKMSDLIEELDNAQRGAIDAEHVAKVADSLISTRETGDSTLPHWKALVAAVDMWRANRWQADARKDHHG